MIIIKGKLLLFKKSFVSFLQDTQSMFHMSKIFLKDNIDGVRVSKFQIAYIFETTNSLHKDFVKFFCGVHFM